MTELLTCFTSPTRYGKDTTGGQEPEWCGDIELVTYLPDSVGSVNLVLDLCHTHPLNESVVDKIRDYRTDYNNRPSNSISFIPDVPIPSDHLHCEIVRILFL